MLYIINIISFHAPFQLLDSTKLFSSHSEVKNGDQITLVCSHHNLLALVNGRYIFNTSGPIWRRNGKELNANEYESILYTTQGSSIKIIIRVENVWISNFNFSCAVRLLDGYDEHSEIIVNIVKQIASLG